MVTGAIDRRSGAEPVRRRRAGQAARLASADPSKLPALLTKAGGRGPRSSSVRSGRAGWSTRSSRAGKFDEAAGIKGKWEAYATKTIKNPVPGVGDALVIAGSDARGTIYGIYSISEEIGVSPWYWYSDVPVKRRDDIEVEGRTRVEDGPGRQVPRNLHQRRGTHHRVGEEEVPHRQGHA